MRARIWNRGVAATIVLTLVITACGGSADDTGEGDTGGGAASAVPQEPAVTEASDLPATPAAQQIDADIPASLDFLGAIPVVEEAHVITFDDVAGRFTFADGVLVDVPEGAFAETTSVEAVRLDLDFDQFVADQLDGAAYVLTTQDDVDLAVPIHLELVTDGAVRQLRDGEWVELEGPRVAIEHFSEVPTVVVEGEPSAIPDQEPAQGLSDPELLSLCIQFLAGTSGDPEGARGIAVQLAFQLCTRGLIERYEPGDVFVSTACVGDRIDTMDLRAAIDACAEEARRERSRTADDDPESAASAAPARGTTVVFDGEFETSGTLLQVGWEAELSEGSGTGSGVVFLDGPCTEGIDGEPGGEVIEEISAAVEFAVGVTSDGETLTVTASAPTLADYGGQNEFCRDAFTQNLGAILPFLEGSVPATTGPATLGSFAGTLTVDAP